MLAERIEYIIKEKNMDANGLSLADIAAVTDNKDGFGGGNFGGIWFFAIIVLLLIGNGGLFGRGDQQIATQADVQRATDTQTLQTQNISNLVAIKEGQLDNLVAIRDTRDAINAGFADLQNCCCQTLRAIDSVNYNGAINTASINANTTAQAQRIIDLINQNKIESQAQRINQLELQSALCGVVRYPLATTYNAGYNPFCCSGMTSGCGCGC